MRHGARANLARFQTLFEITQGHIAPYIARPIYEYGVGARNRIKQLSHVVMRFDLNAVCLKTKTQPNRRRRLYDALAKCFPIEFRPGTQMGVVVAYGAVHLGKDGHLGDPLAPSAQTHHDVGNLFAYGGGASCLAMCPAEHRDIGIGMCHVAQFGDDGVEHGQHHLLAASLQLQSMAGVVDVFAGAGKVHKFSAVL